MALSRINAKSIADGTIVASDIADGIVTNAKLAGSITSDKITSVSNTAIAGLIQAAQIGSVSNTAIAGLIQSAQIGSVSNTALSGVVTASQLASTLDLTGKTVTLPAGTGGKVLGISSITLDTTSADYSGTPIQLGSNPVWYNSGAQRSVTYTKLSATSVLLVHAAYTYRSSGTGTASHGLVVFKDSSTYQILGFDMGRLAGASATRSAGLGVFPFTGLAAGSHTFYVVPARANNAGTHSGGINGAGSSDHPTPSATYIYIVEVEV